MKNGAFPGETLDEAVHRRRVARMGVVDAYPGPIRDLIHEYGLMVVQSFLQHGITEPRIIRHLITIVLQEVHPLVGSRSKQGNAGQNGRIPPGWRLVPDHATEEMVTASILTLGRWRASLSPDDRILNSKIIGGRLLVHMPNRDKHARRYEAMLAASPPLPKGVFDACPQSPVPVVQPVLGPGPEPVPDRGTGEAGGL